MSLPKPFKLIENALMLSPMPYKIINADLVIGMDCALSTLMNMKLCLSIKGICTSLNKVLHRAQHT